MELVSDLKQLHPDLQLELQNFLLSLADTKRALGLRYAEWCDRAPRLEAGVAASAMAQDQLGQARVLYALIQEFSTAPHDLEDETRQHTFGLAYLDEPFDNWVAFVVANFLVGGGVTSVEQALADSRFVPLRARMPKMLDEERFHRVHAEGWFKQLQHMDGHFTLEQGRAIEEILPQVLCWFGDAQHTSLSDAGIIAATPAELRERYLEWVGPLLQTSAARHLLEYHPKANACSYTRALPWGQFDPVTRRISTQSAVVG